MKIPTPKQAGAIFLLIINALLLTAAVVAAYRAITPAGVDTRLAFVALMSVLVLIALKA